MLFIVGVILIIYGVVICTGKKFIMHRMFEQSIILLIVADSCKGGIRHKSIFGIVLFLIVVIISVFIMRGRYTVYNVNRDNLVKWIQDILDRKGIVYEDEKDKIILSECYDETRVYNKEIKIHSFFGQKESELNIRDTKDIEDENLYSEIVDEIRSKAKTDERIEISYSGIIYIVLGIVACLLN